jgi:F-type H+-transporting ATPase subunit b
VNTPLALAAAAAKEAPLVDIDNTFFIQLVVFIVTALVLSKFLFRPFLAMRAARAEGIEGAREEAVRMDDEARAKIADYDVRFATAKMKALEERNKVRGEALEQEREINEVSRRETEGVIAGARQKLGVDAATARAQLAPRAQEIANAIAKKILGREVA